jgi:hypothetical protein
MVRADRLLDALPDRPVDPVERSFKRRSRDACHAIPAFRSLFLDAGERTPALTTEDLGMSALLVRRTEFRHHQTG